MEKCALRFSDTGENSARHCSSVSGENFPTASVHGCASRDGSEVHHAKSQSFIDVLNGSSREPPCVEVPGGSWPSCGHVSQPTSSQVLTSGIVAGSAQGSEANGFQMPCGPAYNATTPYAGQSTPAPTATVAGSAQGSEANGFQLPCGPAHHATSPYAVIDDHMLALIEAGDVEGFDNAIRKKRKEAEAVAAVTAGVKRTAAPPPSISKKMKRAAAEAIMRQNRQDLNSLRQELTRPSIEVRSGLESVASAMRHMVQERQQQAANVTQMKIEFLKNYGVADEETRALMKQLFPELGLSLPA